MDELHEIDWDSSFDSISASPVKSVTAKLSDKITQQPSFHCKQLFQNCSSEQKTDNPTVDPKSIFVDGQKRFFVEECVATNSTYTKYRLKSETKEGHTAWLQLHDLWHHELQLEPGILINIVDVECDDSLTYHVARNKGFVVVNPDQLLSITSVMNQMWCERKSALTDIFKSAAHNEDALRGTIAHDLIGRAMVERLSDKENLRGLVFQCLNSPSIMQAAYACKMTMKELLAMAEELLPYVQDFVDNKFLKKPRDQKFDFLEVCDIEDTYWNPVFGFKGKLDATVRIKYDNGEEKVVPFEFKTGHSMNIGKSLVRSEHTGQVSLYTLLIRPRYGYVDSGLLLYIREKFLKDCKASMLELQYLLCMKNRLALSLTTNNGQVNIPRPGGVDFDRKCVRCEFKNVCSALLRCNNPMYKSPKKDSAEQKLMQATPQLKSDDIEFFHLWFRVITLEVESYQASTECTPIWKLPISEREAKGLCISNLELVSISSSEIIDANGNRCFQLVLSKENFKSARQRSLMLEKDMVVVGTQFELCISYGFIESISENKISVTIERKLNDKCRQPGIRFTLDKVSSSSVLQSQYTYLARLMDPTPEAKRIRDYIIRRKPPKLVKLKLSELPTEITKLILPAYNPPQQKVIIRALETDSFLFVKGMPGTGKTETIIGLLRVLQELKYNVLLVAYTNSAVDNILTKYKNYSTDILRIGSISRRSDEDMAAFSSAEVVKRTKNLDELTTIYNSRRLVASTLLSLKHDVFRQRTFDYCIVDEASQALPTSVFGALMLAKKFVFFGDPDQLPPVIKSSQVKDMHIPESMFVLAAQPVNTVKLNIQYRMNPTIMRLANNLVYKNQMTVGSKQQEGRYLSLPAESKKRYVDSLSTAAQRWIQPTLSDSVQLSIVFLDTSLLGISEEKIGESIRNPREAEVVKQCIISLIECGCKDTEIGVIAPYRGQVAYIRQMIREMGETFAPVEVNTVDQYQGRDKEVIICSFTKSKIRNVDNPSSDPDSKGSILEDLRRLNVAITRAKKKLVLVGNRETLQNFAPFQLLFGFMDDSQFISIE